MVLFRQTKAMFPLPSVHPRNIVFICKQRFYTILVPNTACANDEISFPPENHATYLQEFHNACCMVKTVRA